MPSQKIKYLISIGRTILVQYNNITVHTIELENAFLSRFELLNAKLVEQNGAGRKGNVIVRKMDQKALRTLPNKLLIYRGVRESAKRHGISWTLDRRISERFAYKGAVSMMKDHIPVASVFGRDFYAKGYSEEEIKELVPAVLTGTCDFKDILAYTNEINEQEIIINPDRVTIASEDNYVSDEVKRDVDAGKPPMALPLEYLIAKMQHLQE